MERGAVTRRSTVRDWLVVLLEANPELGDVDELTDWLCSLAGPEGIAAESQYADRVKRRRDRRARRYRNRQAWAERAAALEAAKPRPEARLIALAAKAGDLATVTRLLTQLEGTDV